MPLVEMTALLAHALKNGYAVGYFEAWNLESLLAVREAAEKAGSPVIIGFNGKFLGNPARTLKEDIHVYGAMGRAVAARSPVPMSFILNEADNVGLLLEGLDAGFNVIMHEGCALDKSTAINKQLVKAAHARGAAVEAELGELPHAETGRLSGGVRTDPEEARAFVEATGVDALAVSVGNVHILEGRTSSLDLELITALRRRVPVPLVLHGGTGIAPQDLKKAIGLGVCKINVGTILRRTFINSLRDFLQNNDVDRLDPGEVTSTGGSQDMMIRARARVAEEVARLMAVFGSTGRAAGFR
jgi:ketose-bisphosphate aldolase